MDPLLLDEVNELTSFIRESGEWTEVRQFIQQNGFDPDSCLLVSFMEDEEGQEWGLIATQGQKFFEWNRNNYDASGAASWIDLTSDTTLSARFPQVEAAVAILRLGIGGSS